MNMNNSFVLKFSNQTLLIIFPLSRPPYDLTKTPKKNPNQTWCKAQLQSCAKWKGWKPKYYGCRNKGRNTIDPKPITPYCLSSSLLLVCLRWPVVPLLLSVFHQVSDGSSIKSVLSQMSGRYSVNVFNSSGYQRVSKTELFVFLISSSNLNCLSRPRPKFPLRTSQRTGLTGTARIWTTTF